MAKKEDRAAQAASQGGAGQPLAAGRPGAGSARDQHHGVLQGLQRQDADMEPGAPCPTVITYYQDKSFTMEIKTPPASYYLKKAAKLKLGFQDPGARHRGVGDPEAGARDRRGQDEGSQRQRYRGGDADHSRICAFDGYRGEGVSHGQVWKTHPRRPRSRCRQENVSVEEAVTLIKANASQVRRDRRDRDEPRGRSASCRPDGARRGHPAQRHRQDRPRGGVRARAQGRRGHGSRRRHRRRRGPDGDDPVGQDRVRSLHRNAGHDAAGGPAGQDPRPAQPDAQPQGRHGDHGCRAGGSSAKGGEVQFKAEKAGLCMPVSARRRSTRRKLAENIRAFVDAVAKAKPSGAKGTYLKKVSLSSTMGPGVSIDLASATGN
jgi:ribosomal protein L11